jgi:hypothetical protein
MQVLAPRRAQGVCAGALGLALLLPAGFGAAGLVPSAWAAGEELEVQRMVLAERDLKLDQDQLVQVTVRNPTGRAAQAGLRIELRDEKERRVGAEQRRKIGVAALDETREFFRFALPKRQGKFTVRLELYTPDFKSKLLSGGPVFYAGFTVLGGPEAPPPAAEAPSAKGAEAGKSAAKGRAAGPPSFPAPAGLRFERPDLVWENVSLNTSNILSGEPVKIKADLRNVGGDIARDIEVTVEYFSVRNPNRRVPIARSSTAVLAPGEKVELEFETVFPEDAPLGEYRLALNIDPAGKIEESNRENNQFTFDSPIQISLIRMMFPEPGYAFEESGLFLFRWDSRRFDEFKVQVGGEPTFSNAENYFDLPQGDKWTKEREIVPLEGEMPGMAAGLLTKLNTQTLYWRVLGRDSKTAKVGASQAQPFTIKLAQKAGGDAKPAKAEGEAPSELKPGAAPPAGGAAKPAPAQQ